MKPSYSIHALKGQILQFNLSPKGVPEGFLLKTSESTVQINFDPGLAGQITQVVSEGALVVVEVTSSPDLHEGSAHPVFNLIKMSAGEEGKLSFVAKGAGEDDIALRGVVLRLNYALRGEINGGILDSGEFVHLRPHGVKAIGGLAVGDRLDVWGEVRAGWSGYKVVEARVVNGIEISKPERKHHGPKHDGPKHKTEVAR